MLALLRAFVWFLRAEEKVRPPPAKHDKRYAKQQIRKSRRLLQGKLKFLLHPVDAVEHGVPMGKERVAGPFQ